MNNILAEVLTIGDEILYGQIIDSNSQWISEELDKIGIKIVRKTTVGDVESEILQAFSEAELRADIVLITGGLGPTSDDLTKPCIARYFESELSIHPVALQDLTDFFKKRGRELTEINRQQAAVPDKCTFIRNRVGTAPGMWFEKNRKVFVSMPGVPFEMKIMMEETILPKLKSFFNPPVILHKRIKTIGIGESFLAEKIRDWEMALPPHIKLAYLPSFGRVDLRLTTTGSSLTLLQDDIKNEVDKLLPIVNNYVYGYDSEKIEEAVGKLLLKNDLSIAAAESCTGGFISHLITSISGSSSWFKGGIIAYDNEVKINSLGVNRITIEKYGAVSEETVKEMALGVKARLRTSIGVATSGIAGPTGGTEEKPVGLVWIAVAFNDKVIAKRFVFGIDRLYNIHSASVYALNMVREMVLSHSKENI